jgi:hypothetical protein
VNDIHKVHGGKTLNNTNTMGWRIVSQLPISACKLPDTFQSDAHFFYDWRIIDIDDQIPKS